jgi:hypothetical protein
MFVSYANLTKMNCTITVQLLYERCDVIPRVGNLTKEKSCVCLNFPPEYE